MAKSLGRRDGKCQRRTAPPLITWSAKRGKWASFNRERSEHLAPAVRTLAGGAQDGSVARVIAVEASYRTIEAALKAEIERLRPYD
jgi:hypothetical protein